MPTIDITNELLRILRENKVKGRKYVFLSPENASFVQVRSSSRSGKAGGVVKEETPGGESAGRSFSSHPKGAAEKVTAAGRTNNAAESSEKPAEVSDVEGLHKKIGGCQKCSLYRTRTQTVPGAGNPAADLMFIGEAPGAEEDKQGLPFVGKAGRQLDKMIQAMQFARDEVFIANIIKCRPPGNRIPHAAEAEQCLPYLYKQIELVHPKVLVLLGSTPLSRLTGKRSINEEHGKWYTICEIPAVPTFHPSFLLRSPAKKKEAWEDLKEVMRFLGKDPEKTISQ